VKVSAIYDENWRCTAPKDARTKPPVTRDNANILGWDTEVT